MLENNLKKVDIIRVLGEFNLSQLVEKVTSLADTDWNLDEDYKLNYNKSGKALNQVSHLILRFINRKVTPFQYLESNRWEDWKEMLLPLMKEIVEAYEYKNPVFPKVMLANLPPSSFIPPHIDGDEKGHIPHKIHLPIQTNEKAYFFIDNQRYHFKSGKAYEVNNGLKHSVANHGITNRIHLIFECLDYDLQPEITKVQMREIL